MAKDKATPQPRGAVLNASIEACKDGAEAEYEKANQYRRFVRSFVEDPVKASVFFEKVREGLELMFPKLEQDSPVIDRPSALRLRCARPFEYVITGTGVIFVQLISHQ
jgi:hypothetical protein